MKQAVQVINAAAVLIVLLTTVADAQEAHYEDAAGYIEGYLVNCQHLSKNAAVVGSALVSNSKNPESCKDVEWYMVYGGTDKEGNEKFYREARQVFNEGVNANLWERRAYFDDKVLVSLGQFTAKLVEAPKVKSIENGVERETLVGNYVQFPNIYSLAIMPSTFIGKSDTNAMLRRQVDALKVLEEANTKDGFRAFYYNQLFGIEVTFDKLHHLPVKTLGFYNQPPKGDSEKPRLPDRTDFKLPWFECETKWEKLKGTNDLYAPVHVVSRTIRINPNSSTSVEIDAKCAWQSVKSEEYLNDENVTKAPLSGKLDELRRELQNSLSKLQESRKEK